jgi:hypothetical protein
VDVTGDPAAMTAAAASLRLRADQVMEAAGRVAHAVDTAVYVGPAADRLRAGTADRQRRLVASAYQLQDLADTLARSAAEVAEAQLAAQRAALAEGQGY